MNVISQLVTGTLFINQKYYHPTQVKYNAPLGQNIYISSFPGHITLRRYCCELL